MPYPTLEEVEAAERLQLCKWVRFLPAPGTTAANARRSALDAARLQKSIDDEVAIMQRIIARVYELGGITSEISKAIGWGER